jgi:hypothetical protein
MTQSTEEIIVEILKRELRFVCKAEDVCERCGLDLGGTWMVKPGNIEHCAKVLVEKLIG